MLTWMTVKLSNDQFTPDPYARVSKCIRNLSHPPVYRLRMTNATNTSATAPSATTTRPAAVKTYVVENKGFNPMWK